MTDDQSTSSALGFSAYQHAAARTGAPVATDHPIVYPTLRLANEAGEVAGKVKKIFRDQQGEITDADLEALTLELGDVLWYLSEICTRLGIRLEDIASRNIAKLADRASRGVISGEGDLRWGSREMLSAMVNRAPDEWIYVVTDIETDGPWPGPNSMRSYASVAVSFDGTEHGRFEAVLEELPGAAPNPATLQWFQTVPEMWAAATINPEPVPDIMARYVAWIKALPGRSLFAASPLAFDGPWIDYYLRRFTRYGLVQGPYEEDKLFDGPGLCIRSYAAAVTGRPVAEISPDTLPSEWFGNVLHTHNAIDDALGYANLLVTLGGQAIAASGATHSW